LGQQQLVTEVFTMEEEMIRGLFAVLIWSTFVCSLANAALADGGAIAPGREDQDRSLLAIWDKPAFSPGLDQNTVPWLNSRPAVKGQKIDLLLSPNVESFGPLVAQHANPRTDLSGDDATGGRHDD
jgi:hypothetical protein